jgi:hypothetical protein
MKILTTYLLIRWQSLNKKPLPFFIGFSFAILLTGCASVSPSKVDTDRQSYGEVIAESWKEQTLLNIVRLRYADAPVFLDITRIISSNSRGGAANAGVSLDGIGGIPLGNANLGGTQTWSNTPTISYTPLLGDRFTKALLRPIPPQSVFELIQAGASVEMVFRTMVSSINGLRNSHEGEAADSDFSELVKNISIIETAGGLGLRIDPKNATLNVLLPTGEDSTRLSTERKRIRELLKLESLTTEFNIEFGLFPRDNTEIAMVTRSMLEIMLQLGYGIDLPSKHVIEGRVYADSLDAGYQKARILTHIHSGSAEPSGAFVAVKYKDYWFWIEDTDVPSKRLFTFLIILFSLAETGQNYVAPIVTVPSR